MKISMKIAFTIGPIIILAQVVYRDDISGFQIFEALNKFEAKYIHNSVLHPISYSDNI